MTEDALPQIIDLRQSPTALRVQRGVMRLLRTTYGLSCLTEVPLANGRRADVLAIGAKGEIWIVEVKSSVADFRVDSKWQFYKEFCDRFYFAKPAELADEIFPSSEGLISADGHGAEVVRQGRGEALSPARRKALLLRLVRIGADRVHLLLDPHMHMEEM